MITLDPITATTYKVVIQTDDLTEEEYKKLLIERDRFPHEFCRRVINLVPEDKKFKSYEHMSMVVTVE